MAIHFRLLWWHCEHRDNINYVTARHEPQEALGCCCFYHNCHHLLATLAEISIVMTTMIVAQWVLMASQITFVMKSLAPTLQLVVVVAGAT